MNGQSSRSLNIKSEMDGIWICGRNKFEIRGIEGGRERERKNDSKKEEIKKETRE